MAIKALTYDIAVDSLDKFMQKKTTHGTKEILEAMQSLCSVPFVNQEDQNDFANTCANFDMHVRMNGLTSIGRKQFENWWELYAGITYDETPTDDLPVSFEDLAEPTNIVANHNEPCQKAHRWSVNECVHCKVQDLEREIQELRNTLSQIKGLATWD